MIVRKVQKRWKKFLLKANKHKKIIAKEWDKIIASLINANKHKGKKHGKTIRLLQLVSTNMRDKEILKYYVNAKKLYMIELKKYIKKNMQDKSQSNKKRGSIISKLSKKMIDSPPPFVFMPNNDEFKKMIYAAAGINQ